MQQTLMHASTQTKVRINVSPLQKGVLGEFASSETPIKVKWPPLRLPVESKLEEDQEVNAVVLHFEAVVDKKMSSVIGVVGADLDARCEVVRTSESSLGNLITDIFRNVYKADVSILNGGSIRSDSVVPAGQVTLRHIHTFFPFEDVVMLLVLDGRGILQCLENGVSRAPAQDGRFAHVSGLTFKFDPSREKNSRVVECRVGTDLLDPDKMYTLATNGFLSKGKEGYRALGKARHLIDDEFAVTFQACLIDFFATTKDKTIAGGFKTVLPQLEGRIQAVNSGDLCLSGRLGVGKSASVIEE